MPGVHEMAELAPRDVVAHAIVRQMAATGADNVLLDARHLGRGVPARAVPDDQRSGCSSPASTWPRSLVPVAPAQHYHSGGVVTDLDGRSSVRGLYAVGEVACTGVHGANRLASNSLLEGIVFAHRAAATSRRGSAPASWPRPSPAERPGAAALVAAATRSPDPEVTSDGPGVIRSARARRPRPTSGRRVRADAHLRRPDGRRREPQTAEWETTNVHQVATVADRGGRSRARRPAAATSARTSRSPTTPGARRRDASVD